MRQVLVQQLLEGLPLVVLVRREEAGDRNRPVYLGQHLDGLGREGVFFTRVARKRLKATRLR